MTEDVINKLFEPFFTTKSQGKGTGLGLATVYGIVTQNSGFINVYSEPGQGTTFKIYLPSHREHLSMSTAPDTDDEIPLGHETILLVEDETLMLEMTTLLLDQLGYRVLPAHLPEEALALAETYEGEIDLLMTDVIMPQMNGKDLSEKVSRYRPVIKCLFSSGYTGDIIDYHGILAENVHFIQKPFSKMTLAVKIRQVLSQEG